MKSFEGNRHNRFLQLGIAILGTASLTLAPIPAAFSQTPLPVQGHQLSQVVQQSAYYSLSEASTLIEKKQYADAIVVLNHVVEIDPINIFSQFNLGYCYLELAKIADENGDSASRVANHRMRVMALLKKAEYHFTRVQNLNPDLTVSYFKLGKIALMMNNSELAEHYYKEGLEVEPESAPLTFNLGRVYDQRGDNAKAIAAYQKAIALDPSFIYSYNNLGLMYESQKDYASAEKAYMAALKQDKQYNFARLNLGNLYAELGRLAEAKKQYEDAIRLEPENSWAHLYLGNVYFLTGDYQHASLSYKTSIKLNTSFPTAYYLLAVSLSKMEKIDEAVSVSLQYMNMEPDGKYSEQLRELVAMLKIQKSAAPQGLMSKPAQ